MKGLFYKFLMFTSGLPGYNFLLVAIAVFIFFFLSIPVSAQDEAPGPRTQIILTAQERSWLKSHPVITVASDPAWPPVEFADEKGNFSGMSADYLALIEQRLGIAFKRIRFKTWQEAYERLNLWEIDMTTSVVATESRREFWAFTQPYMAIPIVIATGIDVTYINDMNELRGKKVSAVEGYAITEWIPHDFPGIELVSVPATREGLELVERGDVFAHIDNMLVIGYALARMNVNTIKIAGKTPYTNAQCMAVRKDWAMLAGILQKSLDSISPAERAEIYNKWLPIRFEQGFDYNLLIKITAGFGLVIGIFCLWVWVLFREVGRRRAAEQEQNKNHRFLSDLLEYSGAIIFLKDLSGRYEMVNHRWEAVTGQKREYVLGKTDIELFPGPQGEWFRANDLKVLESGMVHEVEETLESEAGTKYFISIKFPVRGDDGNIRGLCGMITEITERKLAEQKVHEYLRQKEILLKEAHHRVKNNMSTIIGLLTLQAESAVELPVNKALSEARDRLQGMWLLYDKLYRPDMFSNVSLAVFLPQLVREILALFPDGENVELESHIEDFILDSKAASSLGIILNELVTNTMKHAFTDYGRAVITISASRCDGRVTVIFADNGRGLPENVDENTAGFGLSLVRLLVSQINGILTVDRDHGTRFVIEFDA